MNSNFLKESKFKAINNKISIINNKQLEIKHSNKRKRRFNNLKGKLKIFNWLILMLRMVKMSTERMILKVWFMNRSKRWKPMIAQNIILKEPSVTTWSLYSLLVWMKTFLNNFLIMSKIQRKIRLKNKLKRFWIQIIPKLHSAKVPIFSNEANMSV